MRSMIALILCILAVGACDNQSPQVEQPAAATAAPIEDVVVEEKIGTLDRSHAGEAAPPASFQAPDGASVTLAKFDGKPVLLNLWATWCAPCVAEMPTLDRLATREGDALQVLVVSQDLKGAELVTPFFRKAAFRTLKPYLDPGLALSTAFQANLPVTILYDAQGREVWRMVGGMDWTSQTAAELIAEATNAG